MVGRNHLCIHVHVCLCRCFILDQLIQLGRRKASFAQSTLLSADMKRTSLSNHFLFPAPSRRSPKNNHFPASQIPANPSRIQDQEMAKLETELGTYYIRFCGCYWANNRRAGMKNIPHLPPVQFSANRCSDKGSWARGWIWAGLPEKRIKKEYLTTTMVLADCKPPIFLVSF